MTLAGVLVILAACFIGGLFAQTPCTTDGWFGLNCQYQCHCANSATCDKVDGSCDSGCHSDWFGPACQYNQATFTASSGLWWLTDNNDTTCNTGSSQPVTVDLNPAIPLTWVRLVLNDAAYLNQTELSYKLTTSTSFQPCTDLRIAKVDDVTLDIYCPTVTTVEKITLSELGVTKLCSLYISGGRNVALKQPTKQSTRYDSPNFPNNTFFLAQYAVDGRVGIGTILNSTRFTCTHTDVDPSPDWWTVNFTQAVDIIRFLVFNRNDEFNNYVRLIGFTLTAQPESSTTAIPYTYTDRQSNAQASYLVVPSSKISFPVSQVRIEAGPTSQILTLCEVYVFGEIRCPNDKFGLSCERQCNCASNGSCFVHSGGCPDGCATNYAGGDCTDCVVGKYGANCDLNCSVNCGGDNSCDRTTGVCSKDCDPGYTGGQCMAECGLGWYGLNCSSACSANCTINACDHVNGVCDSCPPGKYGSHCDTSCSPTCSQPSNTCNRTNGDCDKGCDRGYWGSLCLNDCNKTCAGQDHACHQTDGACISCQPGLYKSDCLSECNVNCGGPDNPCNIITGNCDKSCDPGYQGAKCYEQCNSGKYGGGCTETCSEHCAGNGTCHHVNGTCDQGCDPGYQGSICVQMKQESSGGGDATTGAIIGAVVGVVVLAVVVAAVIFCRRRRSNKNNHLQPENGIAGNAKKSQSTLTNHLSEPTDNHKRESRNPVRRSKIPPNDSNNEVSSEEDNDDENQGNYMNVVLENTSIPVETLKTYIIHHSADSHFKDEFTSIPMANNSPQSAGLSPQNLKKNRYKNIIPYDSSRVRLETNADKNQSDYINASFMKGYKDGDIYIASQGPNDKIQDDFVRMLWEQKVDRVVMLTNLVEMGKKKCNMYWPSDGEEEFGTISVRLLTTHVFAEFTIRQLRLSKDGESSRELTQFHFTAWPDKSVPESPWGLVDLHQRVMAATGSGPILVHCSAGVGRTGTFIGLCNLLQEAEATGKMDFRAALWKLRQERMHTIQTVAQYIFLHKVALVAHAVAGTTIPIKDMDSRLASLESGKGGNRAARSYLQEFEAMMEACDATCTKPTEPPEVKDNDVYQNASDTAEKTKNRLSNILPNQAFRPMLIAEAHREDTYINAVLVPNLMKDNQDILTQLPLHSTETDFWRLVTQFDVGLIVTYETELKGTDETIGDFLPKSETEPFENNRFCVKMASQRLNKHFNEVALVIKKKMVPGMDCSAPYTDKTIVMLECKTTKLEPDVIFETQEKIRSLKPSGKSRVVYMCRNGADQCGMACVQAILLDRLDIDGCLAVPLVVGTIKAIRPQVIPTVDQYRCLYRVLKIAHDSQNVYGNV